MSLRIVLYAEGVGETGVDVPGPGHLGPAHVLTARSLQLAKRIPPAAVQFLPQIRLVEGRRTRIARGSDLLNKANLHRLLKWLNPSVQPDLAIVLVDSDDDSARKKMLLKHLEGLPALPRRVVAVAIREFEAWLVADETAVSRVIGKPFQTCADPEGMARREAKVLLKSWIEAGTVDEGVARVEIARTCDLERLRTRCNAFADFISDLASA